VHEGIAETYFPPRAPGATQSQAQSATQVMKKSPPRAGDLAKQSPAAKRR
jgi:hypothetical protein